MLKLMNTIRRRRQGQGMTEYIILVALVAIILAVAVYLFRDDLIGLFTSSGLEVKDMKSAVEGTQGDSTTYQGGQ